MYFRFYGYRHVFIHVCVGLQSDRNIATGCVRMPRLRWLHSLAPLLLPRDINYA